jgi:hypothetical protein
VDWIGLAQDRYNVSSGSITCWESTLGLHNWWSIELCSALQLVVFLSYVQCVHY